MVLKNTAIRDMAPATDSRLVIIFSGSEKKDLVSLFDKKTKQFYDEKANGSIRLHFSQGYLAKIETTTFD